MNDSLKQRIAEWKEEESRSMVTREFISDFGQHEFIADLIDALEDAQRGAAAEAHQLDLTVKELNIAKATLEHYADASKWGGDEYGHFIYFSQGPTPAQEALAKITGNPGTNNNDRDSRNK